MTTRDLINAIASGDATEIETSFNDVMAQKVSEKLDSMRADYAQNMFGSSQEEISDEEIADETVIEEPATEE